MSKRNFKRLTFDDLLKCGSSDKFSIKQGRSGEPRIVKKKKKQLKKDEIYLNETDLKKQAADFLEVLPYCKLLKTDNMPLLVGRGRRVKTREPGMSDQHLCIKGLFVAIEAKMPGKDLGPDQVDYKKDVERAIGIHITYHSVRELISELLKHSLISTETARSYG